MAPPAFYCNGGCTGQIIVHAPGAMLGKIKLCVLFICVQRHIIQPCAQFTVRPQFPTIRTNFCLKPEIYSTFKIICRIIDKTPERFYLKFDKPRNIEFDGLFIAFGLKSKATAMGI